MTNPKIRIMSGQTARDGDIVDPLGMDTTQYMRNPVVLWAHDNGVAAYVRTPGPAGGIPIARTLALDHRSDGITAEFEWLEGDPFAARVRNAFEKGFVNTASISWITRASEPLPSPASGRRHTRTTLLEWSLLPVPADPAASRGYLDAMAALGLAPVLSTPASRLAAAAEALRRTIALARGG